MHAKLPVCCGTRAFDALVGIAPIIETPSGLLPAAIAIAQHALPDTTLAQMQHSLDDIAHTVASEVRGMQSQAWFAHLHEHLFVELGFVGNAPDYYNPDNALLPAVMQTRKGLPITLSLIYKLVADRLGLSSWGVGLPGHFVAGIELNGRRALVDAFAGGQLLSAEDARSRLGQQLGAGIAWSDRLMEPVSHRYWITRILQNLLACFTRTGEYENVSAVLEMELVLWPEETRLQRDLALVLARVGRGDLASEWIDLYLQNHPDDPQKESLRHLLHGT